jgi:superfamily II DNA/RNA helicase
MEGGIILQSLDKVMLQIAFNHNTTLYASAQDYASAIMLLRLFEHDHVTKPIVFCPSASSCRRIMALFNAAVRRRITEVSSFDQALAAKLRKINCGHVFQSESSNGKTISEQPMHVRQKLIGQYLTGEFEVLFNTNLLTTGIDFPCCDGVLLTSPTKDPRTLMQRWGRSLRWVSSKPDKKGYLALVSTNPYESNEEVEEREKRLGINKLPVAKNEQKLTEHKFDVMYRIAEFANDPSRRTIGVVFKLIGDLIKKAGNRTTGSEKKKSLADFLCLTKYPGDVVISLTPENEKLFSNVFKVCFPQKAKQHNSRAPVDDDLAMEDLGRSLAGDQEPPARRRRQ